MYRFGLASYLLICAVFIQWSQSSILTHIYYDQNPIVNIPRYGALQGSTAKTAWTDKAIYQFLGVKYAESPSGQNRFKAPVPVKPWIGIRSAEEFGPKCPTVLDLTQMSENERKSNDVEDCLNMAIYTKDLNSSLPVMVFIHGGGFHINSAKNYPPNYILEEEVVLVVIQYRLDALGFLSTNTNRIPGNAGLLDAIQALRFIKENIGYFGGNPNKTTIFGQSSGGAMVSALAISPAVPEGLFQNVIAQAGSVFGDWSHSSDVENEARAIATFAGLNPNQPIESLNQAFVNMDVFELLKATKNYAEYGLVNGRELKGARAITIGGPTNLLPDTPENLVFNGIYNKSLAMIVGTNKNEGSVFVELIHDVLASRGKLNNHQFISHGLIQAVCHSIGADADGGAFENLATLTYFNEKQLASGNFSQMAPGLIDLISTFAFKAPALELAQANNRVNPGKTYLYTFDHRGEFSVNHSGHSESHYPFDSGVRHSDELIYLFPYPKRVANLNEVDAKVSRQLVKLWTTFASTGSPQLRNQNERAQWPPMTGNFGRYVHIDRDIKSGENYLRELTVESWANM